MSIASHRQTSLGMPISLPFSTQPVPPLQTGDSLSRAEFERRYEAMPEIKKAQLIEGIVFMPSPVRLGHHGEPHCDLVGWIAYYRSKTPHLRRGDNSTVRLDEDNEPQPDAMLLLPSWAGGATRIDPDDYVSGSPELVCEICASTVNIDLHAKLNAYRRNGVKEYLVWRVEDGIINWFELVDGKYELIPADEQGLIRSKVFPGLWLDAPALLAGDLAKVFAAVDAGTSTAEHKAFVARLNDRASAHR